MIIAATPLRVSLVGGGTDLPAYSDREDGAVVSIALDSYVYVIIKPMFDDHIKVRHKVVENVRHVDELQHDIVRCCLKFHGITSGIEVITTADLPTEGTGLGSSSALTVGLLHGLYAYRGDAVSAERLAQEACDVELNMVGSPIGKQDQYIAAHGGIQRFDFRRDGTVGVRPVPVPEEIKRELGRRLLLFYTGVSRLASLILQEQAANTDTNLEVLHRMRRRVEPVWEILTGPGNLDEVGVILHDSWQDKCHLANGITNAKIDALYAAARSVSNRIGGKICGAGGGGFLLLYVPPEHQAKIRSLFRDLLEARVGFSEVGSRVVSLREAVRRSSAISDAV